MSNTHVLMIVAGEPVHVEASTEQTIGTVAHAALDGLEPTAAIEDWEVRNPLGALIDLDATVQSLDLPSDARLFLNRRAGTGG